MPTPALMRLALLGVQSVPRDFTGTTAANGNAPGLRLGILTTHPNIKTGSPLAGLYLKVSHTHRIWPCCINPSGNRIGLAPYYNASDDFVTLLPGNVYRDRIG